MAPVSTVVERDSSGNRTIKYFSGGEVIASRTYDRKEYSERFGGSNKSTTRKAIVGTAIDINQQSTAYADNERFIDPETGRELTPFEEAAVKTASGPSTMPDGTTSYTYIDTNPAPSTDPSNFRYKTDEEKAATVTAQDRYNARAANVPASTLSGTNYSRVDYYRATAKEYITEKASNIKGKALEVYDYYRPVLPAALGAASINALPATLGATKTFISGVNAPVAVKLATNLAPLGTNTARVATLAANVGFTTLTVKGALTTGQLVSSNPIVRSGQGYEAYQAGREAAVADLGYIDRAASNVPIVGRLVPLDQQKYEAGVRAYAADRGLDAQKTLKASRYSRGVYDVSFGVGLGVANTISEVGGQVAASKAVQTTGFGAKFLQGARIIGPYGFSEGAAVVAGAEAATGKAIRQFNFPAIGAGALGGYASAAVIGGVIYAAPKKVSNTLLSASYIADPYELYGDVAASGASGVRVSTAGVSTIFPGNAVSSPLTPTISRSITRSPAQSLAATPATTNTLTASQTPTNVYTTTNIKPFVASNVNTPTPAQTFINTPITSRTTAFSSTFTPTPTVINTPVTPIVPVNTPTNTNVYTPTNTNVFTPTFGGLSFPPLLPLIGGGGGRKRRAGPDFLTQSRSYNPSLSSLVLGVRGARPSQFQIKTGLNIRPII